MIWTIIKRELYSNLLELRIQILTLAMLILTLVVSILGIFEYQDRVDWYLVDQRSNLESISNNHVYATFTPSAIRPPEPLSILCRGVKSDLGNTVTFDLGNIPYEAEKLQGANPYTTEFLKLDISIILIWLFSLIALLVSFDAVTREKENGTIKLILSNQVSRVRFLWSKYLASAFTLFILIFTAFLTVLIIFLAAPWIETTPSVLTGIFLFLGLCFLYALVWIGLGMFISLVSNSSATALIVSLAAWVVLMIVIPGSVKAIVGPTHFNKEKTELSNTHREIMSGYGKEYGKIWNSTLGPLISDLGFRTMGGGPENEPVMFPNEETLREFKNFYLSLNPLKIDYADQKFRAAQDRFLVPYKEKVRISGRLAHLSPAMLLESLFMRIAGTSYADYFRYFDQTIQYRDQVLEYFRARNAFRSTRWFAFDEKNDPLAPGHPLHPEDLKNPTREEREKIWSYIQQLRTEPQYKLPADDFPLFVFRAGKTMDILADVLASLSVLLLEIGALIAACFLKVRYLKL